MNNQTDAKTKRKPRLLLAWVIFFAIIAGLMVWVDVDAAKKHYPYPPAWIHFLYAAIGATMALSLFLLARWACCWKNFRRGLIGLAVLVTIYAVFCTVENWRGKRAWLKCKAELEAKGAVLDWDKYIPPSVPDDQNFFAVSTNFYLKFVKLQTAEQSAALSHICWLNLTNGFPIVNLENSKPLVAEISVIANADAKSNSTIKLDSSDAADLLQSVLRRTVGRDANGSAGFKFTEFQITNLTPAKIVVSSDALPTITELAKLIPETLFTNIGWLAVTATADANIFQVRFISGKVTAAADYLAWGDTHYAADLDDVRAALKRPYAIMPGEYAKAWEQPVPNFVTLRSMAQTLAQRSQCYLLLGQPARAMRELTLIHDICAILEKPPSAKPIILVEAMVNVALHGLYIATAKEGLRLGAWRDQDISAIQSQIADVNLPQWVEAAFAMEQAGTCQMVDTTRPSEIIRIGTSSKRHVSILEKIQRLPELTMDLTPHGWAYQNMVVFSRLIQTARESIQSKQGVISPKRIDKANIEIAAAIKMEPSILRPFYFIARIAIPNSNKAMQTCAFNQTLANQLQIVCALERFKLANGNYPDSLAALTPEFIQKIPNDIIGGQPLHYQRTEDGKFLLYSVGWNEADDGGLPGALSDPQKGDWVWKN